MVILYPMFSLDLFWASKFVLRVFCHFLITKLFYRLFPAGQVTYVVETFVPSISSTNDWISLSVIRFMCPFRTFLSQIANGFDPIEYKIERNPLWNAFLNIFEVGKAPFDRFYPKFLSFFIKNLWLGGGWLKRVTRESLWRHVP